MAPRGPPARRRSTGVAGRLVLLLAAAALGACLAQASAGDGAASEARRLSEIGAPDPQTVPAGSQQQQPPQAQQFSAEAVAADIAASLEAAKAEVDAALADPAAAFDAYVANHPDAADAAAVAGVTNTAGAVSATDAAAAAAAAARLSPAARLLPRDAKEKRKRLAIFKRNLRRYQRLNRAPGATVAYGVGPLSHLTQAEFEGMYLSGFPKDNVPPGGAPAGAGGRKLLQSACGQMDFDLPADCGGACPASFDWRATGPNGKTSLISKVRYQGMCGSCAAFSTIATLEHAWLMTHQGASSVDLSEEELMTCTTGDQCKGWHTYWYFAKAVCSGVVMESDKRYSAKDDNSCPASLPRSPSGAKGWSYVPLDTASMRTALAHAPLSIGIAGGPIQAYKSGAFDCGTTLYAVTHAVTIVGFTSGVRMANGDLWDLWTVRNSWGPNWGKQGYFYLRACPGTVGALSLYNYPVVIPRR